MSHDIIEKSVFYFLAYTKLHGHTVFFEEMDKNFLIINFLRNFDYKII